jgi:hypothetical protein
LILAEMGCLSLSPLVLEAQKKIKKINAHDRIPTSEEKEIKVRNHLVWRNLLQFLSAMEGEMRGKSERE